MKILIRFLYLLFIASVCFSCYMFIVSSGLVESDKDDVNYYKMLQDLTAESVVEDDADNESEKEVIPIDYDSIITPYDEVTAFDIASIIYKHFEGKSWIIVDEHTGDKIIDFANDVAAYFGIDTAYVLKASDNEDFHGSYNDETITLGYYSSRTDTITLNSDSIDEQQEKYLKMKYSGEEYCTMVFFVDNLIDVILHETRHAYQHYCTDGKLHSHGFDNDQLYAISYNHRNYKTIDEYGFEEYKDNLIELDAREFVEYCRQAYKSLIF